MGILRCERCSRQISHGTLCQYCPCAHNREDITWGDQPRDVIGFANGNLDWSGTCKCGQHVVEQFVSQGYGTVSEDGDYSFIGN